MFHVEHTGVFAPPGCRATKAHPECHSYVACNSPETPADPPPAERSTPCLRESIAALSAAFIGAHNPLN
jgi:hypothetical protein